MEPLGADIQLDICIEEMVELIHAILKARRTRDITNSVAEELADGVYALNRLRRI